MTHNTKVDRITKRKIDRTEKKEKMMSKKTIKKSVTKWVVGAIVLPAVMLAVRKRIFEYIDTH